MQGLPNDQRRTAKLLGLKEPEVYLAAFQRTGRIISDRKDIAGRELARKFLSAKVILLRVAPSCVCHIFLAPMTRFGKGSEGFSMPAKPSHGIAMAVLTRLLVLARSFST